MGPEFLNASHAKYRPNPPSMILWVYINKENRLLVHVVIAILDSNWNTDAHH